MNDLSALLQLFILDAKVPSLAAAAIRDGELWAAGAVGIRKKGHNATVTLADKYHIGSCTKSMTATLAAILVEEGILSWDTCISEILTSFDLHPGYKRTTLRQLLGHVGGCPTNIHETLWKDLWRAKGTPQEQRLELARGILSKAPQYRPGWWFAYSNAGYAIAGSMLEQAARVSYEKLLRERLFVPLNMTSAGFRAPATASKLDQPYGHNPEPVEPEPAGDNPQAIAPAGAVHCSIKDLATYAQFHLTEQPKLLSKHSFSALHQSTHWFRNYTMGWIVTKRPWAEGLALTHTGSNTTFYTVMWLAPQKHFAAVAACNLGTEEGFQRCNSVVEMLIDRYS